MSVSELEFSRRLSVTKTEQSFTLEASPAECAAIAKRLDIPEVVKLEASLTLRAGKGDLVRVSGTLKADIVQSCVVTLEPLPVHIEEQVDFAYASHPPAASEDDDPEAEIIDPIINGHVEVGEPLVQTLSLSLEPYPRKPGAEFKDLEIG